jgi:phosphoglycolate phosphatase
MAPGLVVFDLDGTLVDSSSDLAGSVNAMLAELAPDRPSLPLPVVRGFIGEGAALLVSRSLARAGAALPLEQALASFLAAYRRCLLETTRPYPGIPEVLSALSAHTLAVLTNKPGELSRLLLDGLGLAERFRHVLGGGDLPARKPDPVGLLELMRRTGCGLRQTLFVGDSRVDVETGRAAAVPVLGVTWGLDPEGLRDAGPDLLLDTPEALVAAVTERLC